MNTITPKEALRDREYAIVKAEDKSIYDLYRDEDTARRIADDLNARYGDASHYAAKVDFGEETSEISSDHESFAEAMDSARRYADAQPFVPLGVGMMLNPILDRLQAAHDQELEKAYEHGKREMER